ncbi:MAG: M23 family metallopeptidase, partial [Myxococcales bacterium]|nr:M23 family metallopeptidase [Myxococcales bacterium]
TPPQGTGSGTPAAIQSVWRQKGPDANAARADAEKAKLVFRWPAEGRLTSKFGRRWGRRHQGIDLAAKPGTPVRAAEAGRVIFSARLGAYGNAVVVRHSEHYNTVYAHNRKLHVRKGDWVERGEKIAEVGSTGRSTGPHLHFEVRRGRKPQDPLLYLP